MTIKQMKSDIAFKAIRKDCPDDETALAIWETLRGVTQGDKHCVARWTAMVINGHITALGALLPEDRVAFVQKRLGSVKVPEAEITRLLDYYQIEHK